MHWGAGFNLHFPSDAYRHVARLTTVAAEQISNETSCNLLDAASCRDHNTTEISHVCAYEHMVCSAVCRYAMRAAVTQQIQGLSLACSTATPYIQYTT
jgi:hypothetical protein